MIASVIPRRSYYYFIGSDDHRWKYSIKTKGVVIVTISNDIHVTKDNHVWTVALSLINSNDVAAFVALLVIWA